MLSNLALWLFSLVWPSQRSLTNVWNTSWIWPFYAFCPSFRISISSLNSSQLSSVIAVQLTDSFLQQHWTVLILHELSLIYANYIGRFLFGLSIRSNLYTPFSLPTYFRGLLGGGGYHLVDSFQLPQPLLVDQLLHCYFISCSVLASRYPKCNVS